jgi:N-acetylglucosaminyldiphosphoundecaprenol N-acetyl-beta-D-mannosaminyltransferase
MKSIRIFDIALGEFSYDSLLILIKSIVTDSEKRTIGYLTACKLNYAFEHQSFRECLNEFDYLHADGTGTFLASRILFGGTGLKKRITGSDFYPLLAREAVNSGWKICFVGSDHESVDAIRNLYPYLKICGTYSASASIDYTLIDKINGISPDLIIVGLPTPQQEEWIIHNKRYLNSKLILAVGDGVRVLAGTKIRGPVILQNLGLEWLVRLISSPKRMWNRYLIGIPKFLFRIFIEKMRR